MTLLAVMLNLVALAPAGLATAAATGHSFVLRSPDFAAGRQIPEEFVLNSDSCTGHNVSPTLKWSGAPAGVCALWRGADTPRAGGGVTPPPFSAVR